MATDNAFVYGKDLNPPWFVTAGQKGDVEYIYQDGKQQVFLKTTTGRQELHEGDTVLYVFDGLLRIPQVTANKFNVN